MDTLQPVVDHSLPCRRGSLGEHERQQQPVCHRRAGYRSLRGQAHRHREKSALMRSHFVRAERNAARLVEMGADAAVERKKHAPWVIADKD